MGGRDRLPAVYVRAYNTCTFFSSFPLMMTINGSRVAAVVVRFQLYGSGAARGGLPYTAYVREIPPEGVSNTRAFFFFLFFCLVII